MFGDEGAHHVDAVLIVVDGEADALFAEMIFDTLESAIYADDDVNNVK